MQSEELRAVITQTGRELLRDGLVARTWGNISARVDETHFLITPSGLDYEGITEEDLVLMDRTTMEAEGTRKPSSEKGIHAAAYEVFPEAGFVIHTHQVYASAIGVAGFALLDATEEEKQKLGGIGKAAYGLPGTEKLWNAVRDVMEDGNHVVLMQNHGVLIVAKDKDEAYANAVLLEEICKRNMCYTQRPLKQPKRFAALVKLVQERYPLAQPVNTQAAVLRSFKGERLVAQLDDMAQMIGRSIPVVSRSPKAVCKALARGNAVFVRRCGAIVCGEDADDTAALKILLDKAAVADLHSAALGADRRLGLADCMRMRFIYKKKYSVQKAQT